MGSEWSSSKEIEIFQEYLRIPTDHPNPNYKPCVQFFQRIASKLKLPVNVYYPGGPAKPIILITWPGIEPNLPTILLNSHMDVVPAVAENWTYPPFSAHMDAEGRIFARGSQDIKCIGLQYLAAIRKLRSERITLRRTIHVLFVPDEEIGGVLGMETFVKTDTFAQLNVGFALDEGPPSLTDGFTISYGERTFWQILFCCHGPTGHGALLFQDTAAEKLNRLTSSMMAFRQTQLDKLEKNPNLQLGQVSSVNLTVLRGGEQINTVPSTVYATFDIRLALDVNLTKLECQIYEWCDKAGGNIDVIFIQKPSAVSSTSIDNSNKFWCALKDAITIDMNIKVKTEISSGATDIRNLRQIGIPAFGFTPINNTPVRLHGDNEFLAVDTYLKGIEIYRAILLRIGNVPPEQKYITKL